MKHPRLIPILLILALLFGSFAAAENAQADLQARFGGQATWEYEGKDYCVKKRLSTMLAAICQDDELLLAYLIAVDDNARRIVPIALDIAAPLLSPDGDAFAQIYALHTPPQDPDLSQADSDAQRLLAAVNGIFPEPLIESYLIFDADGLDLLDGGTAPDPALSQAENAKKRAKAVGKELMNASGSQQMDAVNLVSPYLTSDVKTGAMVKLADKATRYETVDTLWIGSAGGNLIPEILIEYFYDESAW